MTRPRKCRRLRFQSKVHYYKPQGIPMRDLREILLVKEELEAIKLKDYDNLSQIEAAKKMNISQSTFQRILTSARKKLSSALIRGEALRIEE